MKKQCVKVGADLFPPYQYYDQAGALCGIDYEKVAAVFAEAGYAVDVFIDPAWSVVQQKFDAGELDAAFQVQPTPERLKKFKFSNIIREAATEVVTWRTGLRLDNYAQIVQDGLRLGVIDGYTNGPDIDALDDSCKRAYPDADALLLAVSSGEVDVAVFDRGVREYLMAQHGIENLVAVDGLTFLRPLGVIFNDAALRDAFDAAMAKL